MNILDIKNKVIDAKELSTAERRFLFKENGLVSEDSAKPNLIHIIKPEYTVNQNVLDYLENGHKTTQVGEYKFFSLTDIQEQKEELCINGTWNNAFIPLGKLISL